MTHSNRITLWIFLPTRQLHKLVDCWVNLNGKRAWGPQECRQCQKTSAWVSKRAKAARSEGHHKRAIMAEWTRITAHEDRCPWGSLPMRIAAHDHHCPWGSLPMKITAHEDRCLRGLLRGQHSLRQVYMSVCERTQSMCASLHILSLGIVWEKNRRSMCFLWSVCMWIRYMDAARWQECLYFAAKKFAARELQSEAKRSRKRKHTK